MRAYQSTLLGRTEVAEGTMAFQFGKPKDFVFKAGQYIDLTLLGSHAGSSNGLTHTFSIGLCTTICKNVRSAPGFWKRTFWSCAAANDDIRTEMGRIPNSLWKWRSVGPKAESWQKIVAPPTELGNPHQTRVPTLPQRRRRRAADSDQRPTPLKSGALTDSCTEPFMKHKRSACHKL